jgi:hypothetical protein
MKMSVRKQSTTTTHGIGADTMEEGKTSTNRQKRPAQNVPHRSQETQTQHHITRALRGCWMIYTEHQTLIVDDAGYPNFEN